MSTVLLVDADFPDIDLERSAFKDASIDLIDGREIESSQSDLDSIDGLLVQWTKVDADFLDRCSDLKVVGRFGIGVDTIDVGGATQRGIAVVNSGDYATQEVASHTLALTLALLRRLLPADRSVRDGNWMGDEVTEGVRRLSTLRAGIVGLGRIGSRVGQHLQELGLAVAGYDPIVESSSIPLVDSLDELLAKSDVVSLHVPLTTETHHILDERRLALLPPGSFVVNTARGQLIDEKALIEALRSGHLGGAALDVFEEEPMPSSHPLYSLPNVVLSPHVAYYSVQSLVEARQNVVEDVIAVLEGRRPRSLVNAG